MSQGDYNFYQRRYASKSISRNIVAADTSTEHADIIVPKSANHQIWVQRIFFNPTTYSAKTFTFQDDAGTPVPLGHMSIPAAAPTTGGQTDQYFLDFGPEGVALTTGKNLDLIISAAGAAGKLRIEAYEKLVGPVAMASTN
jgi:hypothetical protein